MLPGKCRRSAEVEADVSFYTAHAWERTVPKDCQSRETPPKITSMHAPFHGSIRPDILVLFFPFLTHIFSRTFCVRSFISPTVLSLRTMARRATATTPLLAHEDPDDSFDANERALLRQQENKQIIRVIILLILHHGCFQIVLMSFLAICSCRSDNAWLCVCYWPYS